MGDYTSFLLRLESKGGSTSELQLPLAEKIPSETKKSRTSRLLKRLKKRIPIKLKARTPVKTPIIKYGRKLLERINHLLTEYRNTLYSIKYHDTFEDKERLKYHKLMYQSYIRILLVTLEALLRVGGEAQFHSSFTTFLKRLSQGWPEATLTVLLVQPHASPICLN